MIKRSVIIESKSSLTVSNNQLNIVSEMRSGSVPIEDLGYLVLDHHEIYVSMPALVALSDNNVATIICNKNHLPQGMFLSLNAHHIQQEIFSSQIQASVVLKKNLWRQTIVEKITNQGLLLKRVRNEENHFSFLASKVLSGDSSNMEAVAASFYWKHLWEADFKRERHGDFPNSFLNYGYAIMRAAVARSLAGAGLLNTLGIHHKSKYNAFALADDIMEPFRPIVDEIVVNLVSEGITELTREVKVKFLDMLTRTVYWKDEVSPLMVAIQKTCQSLRQCYDGDRKKIKYPQLWN